MKPVSEQPPAPSEPSRQAGTFARPGRVLFGLVLIGLGVLFLLDQADVLDAGEVLSDWWPVAIIAFGVWQLIELRRSPVGPLIVIGVGVVLLLIRLDIITDEAWNFVWPVALVLVGAAILLRRPGRDVPSGSGEDVVRSFAVFSGSEVVNTSQRFRGGTVTAVFGGATLDLRRARPALEGASVAVTAVFGGVDVLVPRGWRVETTGMPIFGGYDNKVDHEAAGPESPALKVDATAIFGGADIKHNK
jgi:hypothetical protein